MDLSKLKKLVLQDVHSNKVISAESEDELKSLCYEHGLSKHNVVALISGDRKTHYGYRLVSVEFYTKKLPEASYTNIVRHIEKIVKANTYNNLVLTNILEELSSLQK